MFDVGSQIKSISTLVAEMTDILPSGSAGPINALADALAVILVVYAIDRAGRLEEVHFFYVLILTIILTFLWFGVCLYGWYRAREIQSDELSLRQQLGPTYHELCQKWYRED